MRGCVGVRCGWSSKGQSRSWDLRLWSSTGYIPTLCDDVTFRSGYSRVEVQARARGRLSVWPALGGRTCARLNGHWGVYQRGHAGRVRLSVRSTADSARPRCPAARRTRGRARPAPARLDPCTCGPPPARACCDGYARVRARPCTRYGYMYPFLHKLATLSQVIHIDGQVSQVTSIGTHLN